MHNDPSRFTGPAMAFFQEMAARYGTLPNVIYEICNEPEYVPWSTIKDYANQVIPAIRAIDPDNLILVGTPNWCQDADVAAADPLVGYSNVMYSLHFYATTHRQPYRDKAAAALALGLPLFVSEWGVGTYSGEGEVVTSEADAWLAWLNSKKISWINWAFANRADNISALNPGVERGGPWADTDLTLTGTYVRDRLRL
jgi:aryl-phospho-beta-D-glucosidase BglC (GH1 family)